MKIDPKYASYAKGTAMSVDLAYSAMEQDIRAELDARNGSCQQALERLLDKLLDRRAAMEEFKHITGGQSTISF